MSLNPVTLMDYDTVQIRSEESADIDQGPFNISWDFNENVLIWSRIYYLPLWFMLQHWSFNRADFVFKKKTTNNSETCSILQKLKKQTTHRHCVNVCHYTNVMHIQVWIFTFTELFIEFLSDNEKWMESLACVDQHLMFSPTPWLFASQSSGTYQQATIRLHILITDLFDTSANHYQG